jgi:prophage antirepressor-like protein
MSELAVVPFNFQSHEVRTVIVDGEPAWVAKDVCEALGLANVKMALAKINEKHLKSIRLISGGQTREMLAIDEAGLYRLVLRSDKPQAEPFMEWVTSEVLPTIRKTGQYVAPQQPKQGRLAIVLEDYQAAVAMAKMVGLDGNQAFLAADKMMRNMTGVSPLAQLEMLHLVCETQERNLTPTEIASLDEIKGLANTARQVNVVLEQMGLQVARYAGKQKTWVPTEAGRPFAVLLDTNKHYNCGTPVQQLKWKESVVKEIKDYFANMDGVM